MNKEPSNPEHYNQPVLRKAEFITPPNILRSKIGTGGLSRETLNKAQSLIDHADQEFAPFAAEHLDELKAQVQVILKNKHSIPNEEAIESLMIPVVHLRSNGQMFQYPLITLAANKLIKFLEVIKTLDAKALEIVMAFHES